MIVPKGDTEKQTFLRDKIIKQGDDKPNVYNQKIIAKLRPKSKFVDISCGTAHIVEKLAKRYENALYIGFDVSEAMIK